MIQSQKSQLAGQVQGIPISGLYEVCIGVTDPLAGIRYWETFGYRIGPIGELHAREAKALYGVDSHLRSVRLLHQDADHGLVRLFIWEKPTNDGLGLTRLITPGSRWTSTLTRDVLQLFNHAEIAQRNGFDISIVPPQWSQIYDFGKSEPFTGDVCGVRELVIIQACTRQVFFERFGYDLPYYGSVNESSKFRTSQFTHGGLVFQSDDAKSVMFYIDVLGLKPVTVEQLQTYDMLDEGWRRLYEMRPGDVYYGTTVDPPYSGDTPDRMFSGRLLLRRVPGHVKTDNLMHRSRPGSLGYSLFTYRVTDLNAWYIRVASSDATGVTEVMKNEFGELSFSFVAPDGCFWNLIGSEE